MGPALQLPTCCIKHPNHSFADAKPESRCLTDEDKEQIEAFLEICDSPDWQQLINIFGPADTKKYSRFKAGSPIKLIKGMCPLACEPVQIFDDFCTADKWSEQMQ